MGSTELGAHLPTLQLVSSSGGARCRLRLGRRETAVVEALLAQRERSSLSRGQIPLCLTLDELAARLGLSCETPADARRAKRTLLKALWRVSSKLAAEELMIASLHTSLGVLGWAVFHLSEVWAS